MIFIYVFSIIVNNFNDTIARVWIYLQYYVTEQRLLVHKKRPFLGPTKWHDEINAATRSTDERTAFMNKHLTKRKAVCIGASSWDNKKEREMTLSERRDLSSDT